MLFRSAQAWRGAAEGAARVAPLPEASLRIHRALKRAFDPAGVFNRDRLLPGL